MADDVIDLTAGRVLLLVATGDIDRARRQLELHGDSGVAAARRHMEAAIARLRPVASEDELPPDVRRAAEKCRATLSSYLLAAENLETVGVAPATVAEMLRRGTEAGEIAATTAG